MSLLLSVFKKEIDLLSIFKELGLVIFEYICLSLKKKISLKKLFYRGITFLNPSHQFKHKNSPLIATIAITSNCPLNCYHCSEKHKSGTFLEDLKIINLIDELVYLNCPTIALTGGEPLVHKSIISFLDRIPKFQNILIYSTGFGLDNEMARKLGSFKNLTVSISIDHVDSVKHDKLRNKAGAYEKAISAVHVLRNNKIEVHVSSLVTKDRLLNNELKLFAKQMKKHDVSLIQLFGPRAVGNLKERTDMILSDSDKLRLSKICNEINEGTDYPIIVGLPVIEQNNMLGCCAGYSRLYIDSVGNVCPCDFAPINFGNIQTDSLVNIWNKMHAVFKRPGTQCLSEISLDKFKSGDQRNVDFDKIFDQSLLCSPSPRVFNEKGETVYRYLASGLSLAALAAKKWENGSDEEDI